jgi:hypothetical protein
MTPTWGQYSVSSSCHIWKTQVHQGLSTTDLPYPAIIFLGRSAIGTIFTAVFVAILTNTIPAKFVQYIPPAAVKAGLPASSITDLFAAITAGTPDALAAVPGMTPAIGASVSAALANAYAAAYAYVYYAAVAVGIVGVIGTFGTFPCCPPVLPINHCHSK